MSLSSSVSLCLPLCFSLLLCLSVFLPVFISSSVSLCLPLCLPLCLSLLLWLCHFLSVSLSFSLSLSFLCLSVFLSLFLCLSILLSVFLSDSVSLPICQALLPDIDYCKWLTRFVTVELRENGGMYGRDPKWGMICPTVCNYSLRLLQKHEFQLWLIIIVAEVESTWVTYAMDHKIWIFS